MAAQKQDRSSKPSGVSSSESAENPPHIPGEKDVKPTDATLPVARHRPSKAEKAPMPEAAIDRRREVLDDEPK